MLDAHSELRCTHTSLTDQGSHMEQLSSWREMPAECEIAEGCLMVLVGGPSASTILHTQYTQICPGFRPASILITDAKDRDVVGLSALAAGTQQPLLTVLTHICGDSVQNEVGAWHMSCATVCATMGNTCCTKNIRAPKLVDSVPTHMEHDNMGPCMTIFPKTNAGGFNFVIVGV